MDWCHELLYILHRTGIIMISRYNSKTHIPWEGLHWSVVAKKALSQRSQCTYPIVHTKMNGISISNCISSSNMLKRQDRLTSGDELFALGNRLEQHLVLQHLDSIQESYGILEIWYQFPESSLFSSAIFCFYLVNFIIISTPWCIYSDPPFDVPSYSVLFSFQSKSISCSSA